MQPEKSQYLKMGRQTLAATLLVVTATLTIAGPVRAESLCSPRGRIDALVTTGTVPDASSRPRPYATTPGGNDATWLAGDGHPATPPPRRRHPPLTIAGYFFADFGGI